VRFVTPDLGDALVATAIVSAQKVAQRVPLVLVLAIFLCTVKRPGIVDRSHERTLQGSGGGNLEFRFLGEALLLGRSGEDRCRVFIAPVAKLASVIRGVDKAPKDVR